MAVLSARPDILTAMSSTLAPRERAWRSPRPLDLVGTWSGLRRGAGDPSWLVRDGVLWRAVRTPQGPATLALRVEHSHREVRAMSWGRGASWLVEHLPTMLGEDDDPTGFEPAAHPVVDEAARHRPGLRVPRTLLVLESLVPAVIEQKVTGQEAFGAQRRLLRRHGEPAPGPGERAGLLVWPDVATLRALPSWEWLRLGVGPQRADTLARVLAVADRLEECPALTPAAARRRLVAVPGVGVWTAAEVAQRALGDPDAVSFGDYHVAADLGWALTGSVVDDHALVEVLRPFAGHRYRVQQLVRTTRPRRGPRMAPRTHLPTLA